MLVCAVIVIIGLLLFKFLWLKDHGFYFQKGFYQFKKTGMQKEAVHSFEDYYNRMKIILKDMDHEYWIKYTGFDGRNSKSSYFDI